METKVSKEVLLDFYRKMNCIRAFENEAIELAKMNLTRAAVHTYNGEEAIAVGVCAHLTNHDYITSTHRGHGHCVDVRNGQITVSEQVFRHFRKRPAVRLAGVLKVFTEQRAVLQDGHACRLR